MRVLLVQPAFNVDRRLPETPSRALLILGTLAKSLGHEVKIVHQDIDELDWKWRPEIVGITVNTFQVKHAREIVSVAKNHGAKVIVGGPHAIAWDKKTDGNVHQIVVGEGENEWLKFIGAAPSITSIDDIPIPDYSLINIDRFTGVEPVGAMPSLAIMASRGCPFSCTFCNTPVFWGKKVRYRNPMKVVDEVELLHNQYGINEIFFQDDTFNLNHEWAFSIFAEIIKRGLSNEMMFKIACRVNEKLLTKEFLDLARQAGVWNIFYGVESGSQYMLNRMQKGITTQEIKRAIQLTNEARINSQVSLIVGLPGESLKTLAESDTLLKEAKPSWYGWCFFCPFPGTDATKEAEAAGHIRKVDYAEYCYGNVYCRTDVLDYRELQSFKGFAYRG